MKTVAAILIMFIALTAFVDVPTKVVFYGTVVNDTTGLPMAGVDIRIAYGYCKPVTTDSMGNFRIEVEKKYCVDSIFGFYVDWNNQMEYKLEPEKHQVIRFVFKKEEYRVVRVDRTRCNFYVRDCHKVIREQKRKKKHARL